MRQPEEILTSMKDVIEKGIEELKEQNYRKANIEIELLHFIRNCLKDEVDY